MNINNIKNKDFEYWGQWKQPVLSTWFWLEWNTTDSFKRVNIDNITLHPLLYLDGHFWIDSKERQQFKKISERIIQNNESEKYLKLLEETYKHYEKEYLSILNLPKDNKKSYISNLFKTSKDIAAIWIWGYYLTEELGKCIIEQGIVSSESELIEKTNSTKKKTWIEKQNEEINYFAKNIKSLGLSKINISDLNKFPELNENIEKHVEEFDWFESHHWIGEGYNLEKCISQINDIINSPKSNSNEESKPTNINQIIELISLGIYWRTHFAELTAKVAFKSRDVLSDIGREADIDYEELVFLSCEEILALDKESDRNLLKTKIAERKNKGYGCVVDNDKIEIITKLNLKQLLSKMLPKENLDNIKELKGTIANKGAPLRGTTKVIISPDDFHKFKNGDILIAPETAPDFVPIMKKSKAIITDTGGIICHAAIVSRELKKPCIIGTKFATKILQDGDLIEVNANKGIVKILSNHN